MKFDVLHVLLPLQASAAIVGVLALALAPPTRGRMLLVPVWPGSDVHLAADEVARGVRLVAPGPVRGSLVVDGDRAIVTDGLLARGVLTISASLVDCSAPKGSIR